MCCSISKYLRVLHLLSATDFLFKFIVLQEQILDAFFVRLGKVDLRASDGFVLVSYQACILFVVR